MLRTELLNAVHDNHPETVCAILNQGVNIDIPDVSGNTALIYATKRKSLKMVNLLLEKKANIDHYNHEGRTALMYAVCYNYLDIARLLLTHGAKINYEDNSYYTPLIQAARFNRIEHVNLLLSFGATVDFQNSFGNTALIWSVIGDSRGSISKLLSHKADINHQNKWGNTALIWAVSKGDTATVKDLLSAGAEIELKGPDEKMNFKRIPNNFIKGVSALSNCASNSNGQYIQHKYNALEIAITNQYKDIIKVIKDEINQRVRRNQKIEATFSGTSPAESFFQRCNPFFQKQPTIDLPKELVNLIEDYLPSAFAKRGK